MIKIHVLIINYLVIATGTIHSSNFCAKNNIANISGRVQFYYLTEKYHSDMPGMP